jgi:hypothetical protein
MSLLRPPASVSFPKLDVATRAAVRSAPLLLAGPDRLGRIESGRPPARYHWIMELASLAGRLGHPDIL